MQTHALATDAWRFFAVCWILLLCQATRASETERPLSPAVLVGGERFDSQLSSIEEDGAIRFNTPSGDRTIVPDGLVRWGSRIEAQGGRIILLAEGSEIAASAWTAGNKDALRLEDDTLAFAPTLFEPVALSRHLVRAVLLKLPADLRQRDRLLQEVHAHAAKGDAILLTGGDRLTGRITKIDAEHVWIETSLGPVQTPLAGMDAVVFSSPLVVGPPSGDGRMLVGLSDGSLAIANELSRDGDQLVVKLDGDVVLRGITVENIASLQPLGSGIVYLSDVEPHQYVHVPFLDLKWPLGRDQNCLGGRLRTGGRLYSKGLGVHSAARLVYRLDGTHKHFAAQAAIDDAASGRGSVTFRVLLAEGDAWRETYISPVIRGGDEPAAIFVPLGRAKGLALVIDYADRGDELDHADWLDARLE